MQSAAPRAPCRDTARVTIEFTAWGVGGRETLEEDLQEEGIERRMNKAGSQPPFPAEKALLLSSEATSGRAAHNFRLVRELRVL